MRLILVCGAIVMMSGIAAAQRERVTGGRATVSDPMYERMGRDPLPYKGTVSGTVLELKNGVLVVERADKSLLKFVIDAKTRVRADKDTALAGKKDLSVDDYKTGDPVKVTYRLSDNRVLEIRLKHAGT